jgi:hypothetical protein
MPKQYFLSKNILPQTSQLFWPILFVLLYEIMRRVENVPIITILTGIPLAPQQNQIATSFLNIGALAFLAVPVAGIFFQIYISICKAHYRSIKLINWIFFLIFTICFYPFEYTLFKFLFLFSRTPNVPVILRSFWVIPAIIFISNLILSYYQKVSGADKIENMWVKVLGNQMQRMLSYVVVVSSTLILAFTIDLVF